MACSSRSRLPLFLLLSIAMTALFAAFPASAADWVRVGEGKLRGVSGMALLSQRPGVTEFVVVHDNKGSGEPRLGALIVGTDKVSPLDLDWPEGGAPPADLESISSVPGQPGAFLAVTSSGRVFHVTISGTDVGLKGDFHLPCLSFMANIEGFTVQQLAGRLVAVWGHRGSGSKPGRLSWGFLDLANRKVSDVSSIDVTVPYPSPSDPNTRHISDLKLDPSGVVWAAAASDPGDSGPFASAVYTLGVLHATNGGAVRFEPNRDLTRLWVFPRKVEALELTPGPSGAVAFGSDDEDAGGWFLFQ